MPAKIRFPQVRPSPYQYNVLKSDLTVYRSKVYKDRLLAITLNWLYAARLAITFKGMDECKVPKFMFLPIYIQEHISDIQESEFQKGKKIVNLMSDYFWSFMVFFFVGLFLTTSFFKVWRQFFAFVGFFP